MKRIGKLQFPEAWVALHPGEFMFTRKAYHELRQIADLLRTRGVNVQLRPAEGGYHIVCLTRKAPKQ